MQVHGFRNIGNTWSDQHQARTARCAAPHRFVADELIALCCSLASPLCSFLNCILQALASLPSFTLYLEQLHAVIQSFEAPTLPRPPTTAQPKSIASRLSSFLVPSRSFLSQPPSSSELIHHFLLIQTGSQRDPSPLYRLLTREAVQFRGFRQQDAHELLLAILDLFDKRLDRVQQLRAVALEEAAAKQHTCEETKEELTDSAPALPAPTDPFVGATSQFLVCLACSYSSPPTRTSFNTLTLPLPQLSYHSLTPVPLESCINDYTSNERVDGVRCAMCGPIETRTACVMQLTMMANSDREWTDKRCDRYRRLSEQYCAMEERMQKLDPRLATKLLSNAVQPPSSPPAAVLARMNAGTLSVPTAAGLSEHQVPRTCIKKIVLSQLPKVAMQHQPHTHSTSSTRIVVRLLCCCHLLAARRSCHVCCCLLLCLRQVLCIHLNRLCGDRKLSTRALFDRELDLAHFTPAIRATHSTPAVDRSCSYRLCSVVCHHGGAVGGHYTCYRQHDRYHSTPGEEGGLAGLELKDGGATHREGRDKMDERKEEEMQTREGGEERKEARLEQQETSARRLLSDADRVWVHVSDDEVRRVSWREVANCEAYMLFYEKETL